MAGSIRPLTTYKNQFLAAKMRAGGFESVAAFANFVGTNAETIKDYLEYKKVPGFNAPGKPIAWNPVPLAMARVLGCQPADLFPPRA